MSPYWICCKCDAPLVCASCGVEQPDDSMELHHMSAKELNAVNAHWQARALAAEAALEAAIPHIETLHSLTPIGEARRFVYSVIKKCREATSSLRQGHRGGEV